jgi:hypothetical protein
MKLICLLNTDIFTPDYTASISTKPFPNLTSWEYKYQVSLERLLFYQITWRHIVQDHDFLFSDEEKVFCRMLASFYHTKSVTFHNTILYTEHGFRIVLRNISVCLPDITASHPKRQYTTPLPWRYRQKVVRKVPTFIPDYTASDSKSFHRKLSKHRSQQLFYYVMLVCCGHYLATAAVYRFIT